MHQPWVHMHSMREAYETLSLFLSFFTPVPLVLFCSCLSAWDRQLLRSLERLCRYCGQWCREQCRKCFSSACSPKWSMHYLSCACALYADIVRVRDMIWTSSSMGLRWCVGLLEFRRIPERVGAKAAFLSNHFVRNYEKNLLAFLRYAYLSCADIQYWN